MENFQNVTVVNPFDRGNEIWAVCYLGNDTDNKNLIKLDKKNLQVIKNGKSRSFNINEISNIRISKKRLLLPLILGGILAPLALIAIYNNLSSPFLLLTAFFTGIFLLYLGWAGSHTLIIEGSEEKEEYVFFRSIPRQLVKFIEFMRLFLSLNNNHHDLVFYHIPAINKSESKQEFKTTEEGYVLLTPREFEDQISKSSISPHAIRINPLKLDSPVHLKQFSDGTLFFTVRSINPESILS